MPKEILEQEKSQWDEYLSDFEEIYPVFAKYGFSRNTALHVFTHYDGTAPHYNDDEGEEWQKG